MLSKLAKKALTKPVWYYHRYRPYFVARRFNSLEQIAPRPVLDGCNVYVLCTLSTLYDGAFSAWSWSKNSGIAKKITIVVDGLVASSLISDIQRVLPLVDIVSIYDLIDISFLQSPGFKQIYELHPLGKKLLMILSLQVKESFIYSDCDVLVFNKTQELSDCLSMARPAYNQELAGFSCYDDEIINYADGLLVFPSSDLNSGMLLCIQNSLDLDLAECLAHSKSPSTYNWFVEQTILAVLMGKANSIGLPRQKYVVNSKGQFLFDQDIVYDHVVTRHFTGPVRHLMYGRGYSLLRQSC